jgi:Zn-dependent protease
MSAAETLVNVLIWAPPVILAITVHEMGHGWMARRLGDPTAERLGRLSPNPLRHLDPIGSILVPGLLYLTKAGFLFGWAKPVPVDWRNFRRPRHDMALVAVAGPGANLLMLLGWVGAFWLALIVGPIVPPLGHLLISMGQAGIIINSVLIALNLLPLPPLDGSRILTALLPLDLAIKYNRLEPYGLIIVVLLMMTGLLGYFVLPLLAVMEGLVRILLPG